MENKNKKIIPNHVGIIMDGNRRWARERNLPTLEGHHKGYEKMKQSFDWFFSRGIKIISIFVFSTENWNRSRAEVNYLMKLLKKAIDEETAKLVEKNYKVLISGRIDELPGDLPESCHNIIDKTKNGSAGIINICLNYGGRAEIVDAVKKMIKNKIEIKQVHEGMIRKYLYNGQLADPDIIVRTSGERRLSGFQLWQSAYSELYFMEKYWPDFEERDVDIIIEEYNSRTRRFRGDE
ncbi:di-trans,poly-cis-decaprenylcistransferase [Candidatus Falkowbacteria bacterium CG1_02_37_44]|uniref:Isoprenyl transferase n=2 Tax=Candidatus Falkowiibacteriota TaxID=1752728 RepID=A0A1J4T927_9BACT|nr:MAG: di-trans,poly-cis-decaprenylcistransferase [Candidatus Falkowbacteria bacterium CG1_02_37_44]PIV51346.1 MAG: di-trans,poly-cis-decaprenylcistransferase [Candidatus Falkowbacteria bacterium CG02_land_8_20_14_3_00_36_14]